MRRLHIFGFGIASILGWASFFGFIFFTEPEGIGTAGLVLFYMSFFTALFGSFAAFNAAMKKMTDPDEWPERFGVAARRSAMVSFILVAGLALQGMNVLNLRIMAGLVISIGFLELYLLSRSQSYGYDNS